MSRRPTSVVALLGKNPVDVAPPIDHADDLNVVVANAIEDDVWVYDEGSEAGDQLIARAAGERPLLEPLTCSIDAAKLVVGHLDRRLVRPVAPDFDKVLLRLGRPDSRSTRLCHAGRALA
jgi:hypothetical protein